MAKKTKKIKRKVKRVIKRKKPAKIKRAVKRAKILVKKNPTKARKRILTGPSQSRRKRVWSGKVKVEQNQGGFSAQSLFRAKIKVIGVGGGGGSIVSEIGRSLQKATFVVADTDIRALKKRPGIKYIWFGENLTRGLGTGVNVDLAKQAAQEAKEKILPVFQDQDIIIFIASLGGGLGSGATQIFAEEAKKFGGITVGIFTMPFKFEGKNKYRIAQNALKNLRQSLNVSMVIPNERIFKIIDQSTPITTAFSTVNKSLIESLESLIDLIYNPGIINIDFADLRTILRGRGNTAFLNTIEETGKDRVEKTCANIFKNPLLQNNTFKAEKILFNIAGADGLSMFDVEKISSHIANVNPKAKIIFGISKNPKFKSRIKTTILMTDGRVYEETPPKVEEEEVKEKVEPKKPLKVKPKIKKEQKKPVKPEAPAEVLLNINPIARPEKVEINQITEEPVKKAIRRNALEIKKAEEMQEKKRLAQEKKWEIPAFLRKVKFNK